jgi:D-alanine transaminase
VSKEPTRASRPALANVNGEVVPLAEVKVSALDRGFLFGDAVYEVLRVYAGKPWLQREHFERLGHSLEAIRIGGIDLARLARRMHQTIAAGPFGEAIVYIQITRGAAPRIHPFPAHATPLELLWVQEFHDPYVEARQSGARALLQPDIRWGRCDIKSTNLLANVLAAQAAKEAGCKEALLVRPDGTLSEGTHTSLFGVRDGCLLTTPRSTTILPGITRRLVLTLAERAGVPLCERSLRVEELPATAELFVTGTTSEVLPIVAVDDLPIADGRPGPVTRRLQAAYEEAVREFVAAPGR